LEAPIGKPLVRVPVLDELSWRLVDTNVQPSSLPLWASRITV
jgi:hypothetical protein